MSSTRSSQRPPWRMPSTRSSQTPLWKNISTNTPTKSSEKQNKKHKSSTLRSKHKSSAPYLPPEILEYIFYHCTQRDLFKIIQSSKAFHGLGIPFLYQNVDLSVHNLGLIEIGKNRSVWADQFVTPQKGHSALTHWRNRQAAFLRRLHWQPELATHIKHLTWTLNTPWGADNRRVGPLHKETNLWKTFGEMISLRSLDLCGAPMVPEWERDMPMPRTLFPLLTSLRLSGLMHLRMATTILNSLDPSKLRHLDINYLQDEGFCNGKLMAQDMCEDCYESRNNRRYRFPGPMLGALSPLIGKCTALETIILRKGGAYMNGLFCWSCSNDRSLLKEWAAFLVAARMTLESIIIGQADHDGTRWEQEEVEEIGDPRRPMDRRFLRYNWPIFTETKWPALKRLEIRGVGRDKNGEPTLTDGMRAELRQAVQGVEVVIEEKEERLHCLFEGMDGEDQDRDFPPNHHWEFKCDYLYDDLPKDLENLNDLWHSGDSWGEEEEEEDVRSDDSDEPW